MNRTLLGFGAALTGLTLLSWWAIQSTPRSADSSSPMNLSVAKRPAVVHLPPAAVAQRAQQPADQSVSRVPASLPPEEVGTAMPTRLGADPYAKAEVLRVEETRPDPEGKFWRLRLMRRSHSKYPLIRVDEQLRVSALGETQVLSRDAMVADHVIVRLEPGFSREELTEMAMAHGGSIRREIAISGIFLVSFDGSELHAIENFTASLAQSKLVAVVEPDYLVHASR